MNDILLLKLGEIVLKGLNRRTFESRLLGNIRRRLAPHGKFRVYVLQSTVYVEPVSEDADLDGAMEAMQYVFGVVAISRAMACEKDKDAIYRTAKTYLGEELAQAGSFKVESKRSDKSFPMTSIQLSQYVGGMLSEAFPQVKVDLHQPEMTVHLEIRDLAAYVHGSPLPGAGGMPVGSNGKVISLLSGGIDSPVSTYMAAKRGVSVLPVHFFSFPYTSEQAKEKVMELARTLQKYCGHYPLLVVPFTHIQEEIRDKCPEEYFTLVMRRFMMRIAQKLAYANDCKGIVTGESLGQVASQTLEAMATTDEVLSLPMIRPLVCMDKTEIVAVARRIGTFDTSILPYEDCCTVFTPRHPRTRPRPGEVADAETALDVESLVNEAVENTEKVTL